MDDTRSLDPDVVKSRQVLADIEKSLERMHETSYDLGTVKSLNKVIEQHMLFIKGLFILICFIFTGFSFGGLVLWYHFQLDNTRFIAIKEQVDIMNTRQEFLVAWQKSTQEQIVKIHEEHLNKK